MAPIRPEPYPRTLDEAIRRMTDFDLTRAINGNRFVAQQSDEPWIRNRAADSIRRLRVEETRRQEMASRAPR